MAPLIDYSSIPGFEKPIDAETERLDKEFVDKGLNAKSSVTESMQKGSQDVLGSFHPDLIAEVKAKIQAEEGLNKNTKEINYNETIDNRKQGQKELSKNAYSNLVGNLDLNIIDNNNEESGEKAVEKLLEQTDIQEENKQKGFDMIYNEEFISTFYDVDPKINQENKEFLNYPEVQEDLSKILENFLLPSNVNDLSHISEKDKIKVGVALDSAFDIQISKLLDNKVNYPLVTVEKMITDIHKGNPFEKIELYEELKQLVNNGEGISGKAMDKNKTAITKNIQKKLLVKIDIQSEELLKMLEKSNISKEEINNIKEELDQLESIKDKIVSGEAMSGGEEDVLNEKNIGEGNDVI